MLIWDSEADVRLRPFFRSQPLQLEAPWELVTRWSYFDLTDGAIEGGEMGILSAGGTWWLSSFFNVQFAYRLIELDRLDLQGTSDGLLVRLVLILE